MTLPPRTTRPPPRAVVWLVVALGLAGSPGGSSRAAASEPPWPRHTIDRSSVGADGVRLADANGDGLPDIVTGWEEGGVVRLYQNPGPVRERVAAPWPAVTVGRVGNVEDAVMVDLDADGALDVVSCTEGSTRTMFVHWGPKDPAQRLDPGAWRTEPIPGSAGAMMWMFCEPLSIDGQNGIDLVAGGKGPGAQIGWWQSPAHPRQLGDWTWHPLRDVGWVMSLVAVDMDGDGDRDVLGTDRKGPRSGCFWLENPGLGANLTFPWREHSMGGQGRETMFLTVGDLDGDGLRDVIVAVKPKELLFLRRLARDGLTWEPHAVALPAKAGNAKAVAIGDLDLDGRADLVFTCEGADGGKSGVMWLSYRKTPTERDWQAHEISGPDGVKHDLVQLLDLDDDGDLDVLTCEETRNLGVFWYANPLRR